MANRIIFRNDKAKEKETLINEINELMKIPSDRVVIFFATEDSTDSPEAYKHYNEVFRQPAFYNEGIPCKLPHEIHKAYGNGCFANNLYDHFIWISKRICEAKDIPFTLIYTHELHHLIRHLFKNENLYLLGKIFREIVKNDLDNPIEFDCDIKSKKIAIDIFGEDDVNSFLENPDIDFPRIDERYKKLLKWDINKAFDVEDEAIKFIWDNEEELKRIQEQKRNQVLEKIKEKIDSEEEFTEPEIPGLNFEAIRSIENPHEAIKESIINLSPWRLAGE